MKYTLIEDKGNKVEQHKQKNDYWARNGVSVIRSPLPVGDYILLTDKVQDMLDRKAKRDKPVKKMDYLGTYDVAVDTKKDIQELVGNVCGDGHDRFRDELILAQNNGIKLYILVQNDFDVVDLKREIVNHTIHRLEDLHSWINPRLWIRDKKTGKQKYPRATKGVTLMKACMTLEKKYGCKFVFCSNVEAGAYVLALLGVAHDTESRKVSK